MPLDPSSARATLRRLASILEAAIAVNVEIVSARNVVLEGGRARIPNPRRVVDVAAAAPEAVRTGPTPGTLVYSAALLALEGVAPGRFVAGSAVQAEVQRELSVRWASEPALSASAIALLVECLDTNPYARPNPDLVRVRIDGLTGAVPPPDASASLAGAVRVYGPPAQPDPMRRIVIAALVTAIAALLLSLGLLVLLLLGSLDPEEPVESVRGHLVAPMARVPEAVADETPAPPPTLIDVVRLQGPVPPSPPAKPPAPRVRVRQRPAFHDDLIDPWARRRARGAPDDQAMARFDDGRRSYAEGDYGPAIRAFEDALALSGRPTLHFDIANAKERLGDLPGAIEALQIYRAEADAAERTTLDARIASLQTRLRPPPVDEGFDLPRTSLSRRRATGWALAGVGGVLAAAGTTVSAVTSAQGRQSLEEGNREAWERTRPVNQAAFAAAVGGVAVGVTGLTIALRSPPPLPPSRP